MKKSIFTKVGAAAVVLTLVTASLVGGTFAKYTSSASGSAKATIAKWDVAFTGNSTEFTKDLEIALEGTGADKTVAPGDTGELVLAVNAKNTQVDVDYTITLPTTSTEGTSYLKFYLKKDDGTREEIKAPVTGKIKATDTKKTFEQTLVWELASIDDTGSDNAMQGKTETYAFSITAEQASTAP